MSIVTDNHSQMLCNGINAKEFLLSPRDGPSAVGDKRRQKTVLWVPLVVALSTTCCAKDVTFKESESEWKSLMCSSVSIEDKPICVSRFLAALYKTTNVHTSSSEISSVICLRLTKGFKSVHNGDGMPPFSRFIPKPLVKMCDLRLCRWVWKLVPCRIWDGVVW